MPPNLMKPGPINMSQGIGQGCNPFSNSRKKYIFFFTWKWLSLHVKSVIDIWFFSPFNFFICFWLKRTKQTIIHCWAQLSNKNLYTLVDNSFGKNFRTTQKLSKIENAINFLKFSELLKFYLLFLRCVASPDRRSFGSFTGVMEFCVPLLSSQFKTEEKGVTWSGTVESWDEMDVCMSQ